jgi:hypothetical protein
LPTEEDDWKRWKAKDYVDNVEAGRAAKGATLVACSKKIDKFRQGGCRFVKVSVSFAWNEKETQ